MTDDSPRPTTRASQWCQAILRGLWASIKNPLQPLKWLLSAVALALLLSIGWFSYEQIADPPVLIQVVTFSDKLKEISPDGLNRSIVADMYRIQKQVRVGSRSKFSAVVDLPTVAFKAESVDFDLEKNILQPFKTAFGKRPLSVQTTVSCRDKGCAETSDKACGTGSQMADDKRLHWICLVLTTIIEGDAGMSRFDDNVAVSPDSMPRDVRRALLKVAERVVAARSPIVAASYQFEKNDNGTSPSLREETLREVVKLTRSVADGEVPASDYEKCIAFDLRANVAMQRDQGDRAIAAIRDGRKVFQGPFTFNEKRSCNHQLDFTTYELLAETARGNITATDGERATALAALRAMADDIPVGSAAAGLFDPSAISKDQRLAARVRLGEIAAVIKTPREGWAGLTCAVTATSPGTQDPDIEAAMATALNPPAPPGRDITFQAIARFTRALARLPGGQTRAVEVARKLQAIYPTRRRSNAALAEARLCEFEQSLDADAAGARAPRREPQPVSIGRKFRRRGRLGVHLHAPPHRGAHEAPADDGWTVTARGIGTQRGNRSRA